MRTSYAYTVMAMLWLIGAAGFAVAEVPQKTKGPIPEEAIDAKTMRYKHELIPDYISVTSGHGKVVGYVRKEDWQDPERRGAGSIEVVDGEDLDKPIGHMVRGKGFVPLDAKP